MKKNTVIFLKITILAMLMFGQLYRINYAIDTYYTFFTGFKWSANDMILRNGRVVIALCYQLFSLTRLPNEYFYYISFFMAMVFLVIAVWIYTGIINRYLRNENLSIIISFIAIVNIFIIEFFMFIEKGPFMLGVFFNVIIVHFLQKFIDTGKYICLIEMIVFNFLTILTYQGIICLYFILALPIVYKSSKNLWDYIKYIVILCITYWIPVIVELLMFNNIFSSTRSGYDNSETISEKIEYIKNIFIRTCMETFDIIPRNAFLIVVLLLVLISLGTIIHKANKKILNIINMLIIIVACSILPMASIIGATGWDAPRIVYPLASVVGILVINYYVNINGLESRDFFDKCSKVIILGMMVCYLVIQYGGFVNIEHDRFESNYADRVRIQEIGQAIAEYEEDTGNKIKYICFYRDGKHDYPYYKDINDSSDLAISSFHSWDSQLNAVNYYLDTNYKRSYGNQWYTDYFAQFDWHCYSPSQIECDGDTLHYCVY